MSIRNRLLLGYVGVIVILMASGALVIDRMSDELESAVQRDAQALSTTLREKIDQALRSRIQSVQAFAGTSSTLQDALIASNADFARQGSASEVRARIQTIDEAWTAAKGRIPLAQELLDNDVSAALRRTLDFHHENEGRPVFAEIFVTGAWGANVGQTGRTTDYLQSDETFWKEAWAHGLWVSDEVTKDESAQVHSLDIGVRVDGPDGVPVGVLKAVLNITDIRETIDSFAQRSGLRDAFLELVDVQGRIVHRQGDDDAFERDLSSQEAVRRVTRGEQGAVVEAIGGTQLLRAFAPAPVGAPPPRWSLVLNQRTSVVFKHADELRTWMVGVGILASLAATLLGFFLSRSFAGVTQRLAATSKALEQNEARLRSVVDGAVDGIVTIRKDGTIESVNSAFSSVFGYTEEEMLGQNVRVLMLEPHAGRHDAYIQRYLATDVPHVIGTVQQLQGRRKDGTAFPLELAVSEVRAGELRLFVGILRDVTASHEAHVALEEAKEAAEAASRSKGQFLANMSHELRTPLNAIIGYAEMVGEELEERGEQKLVSDLDKVRSAGRHLLGLINDILDVSKIEAGRMEVHLEQVEMDGFLEEAMDTVRPLMEQNDNELVLDAPAALGSAPMDVTKLRQILFNLLSNAAKFTRAGLVTLRARRMEGLGRDWLELRVEDTGIGMTPEQLEHVWEAFAQADASTTREFGGTGLGLTITRSFCEMLGGTIDVESRRGEGTAFTLRLPIVAEAQAEEALPVQAAPRESALPAGTLDQVLVIDDDPAARELVRRFLARQGMDVVGAASGREGLRLAAKLLPSAIVLDVMMPGMDGWAVLDKLKGDPQLAHIPVVMLTMVDERKLGFALGVDAYVTKPVDRATLTDVLAQYRMEPASHRVLVVEDDADARTLLRRRLTSAGWLVTEARDGLDALTLMQGERPDLILTDLMMPRMDGFEFVDHLQREPIWRDIPVIVLTSKDITEQDATRLEGAIEHLLQKGAHDREALLAEVGRLVRTAVLRRRAL